MKQADRIVYGTNDVENSAPLNYSQEQSPSRKVPRCSTKAKLITAGITLVALTMGGLGYYYGTKAKDQLKPSYTYKRFVNQNQTNSSAFQSSPLSLTEL